MSLIFINFFFPEITEHGGHHGHSHGGLSRPNATLSQLNTDDNENNSFMYQNQEKPQMKKAASAHGHSHDSGQMNMRGAFLHVLSDALGSVIVVFSALVNYFSVRSFIVDLITGSFLGRMAYRMGIPILLGSSSIYCSSSFNITLCLATVTRISSDIIADCSHSYPGQ